MGGGAKEWLPDEPRMVYVGNLAWAVKWQELKDHMKQVGEVEFAKILTFDGSDWGRSRGVAYVRFATEAEAKRAVEELNQTELSGRPITVDAWTGAKPRPGGGVCGSKGWGVAPQAKGCGGKAGAKGAFGSWSFKGGFGPFGKLGGKAVKVHGDLGQMVYVGNLPFKAEWQELKDHMKQAGSVEFAKVLTEDGTDYGRSRGIGCVRYTSTEEAQRAVETLNGSQLMGRSLVVDAWTRGGPAPAAAAEAPAAEPGPA